MTVVTDAIPTSGTVIAAPVIAGAAGPAGGVGPVSAGGLHDAVADAADPFGSGYATAHLAPGRPDHAAPAGLVPAPLEPLLMFAVGIAFITGVSLLRRRQRRRQGWGVLPERSGATDQLWQ